MLEVLKFFFFCRRSAAAPFERTVDGRKTRGKTRDYGFNRDDGVGVKWVDGDGGRAVREDDGRDTTRVCGRLNEK